MAKLEGRACRNEESKEMRLRSGWARVGWAGLGSWETWISWCLQCPPDSWRIHWVITGVFLRLYNHPATCPFLGAPGQLGYLSLGYPSTMFPHSGKLFQADQEFLEPLLASSSLPFHQVLQPASIAAAQHSRSFSLIAGSGLGRRRMDTQVGILVSQWERNQRV